MSVDQFLLSGDTTDLNYPEIRPSLDLNFSRTKTLDPRITFTRASGGSYVGADGLIKYAGVNEPRFDHDPETGESLGLLIEESRTNLIRRSEEFETSGWFKKDTSIRANVIISPDGKLSGSQIVENLENTTHRIQPPTISYISGNRYTLSIYAKKVNSGSRRFLLLRFWGATHSQTCAATFDIENGIITSISTGNNPVATIQNVGNDWYRCSLAGTADGTANDSAIIQLRVTGGMTTLQNYQGNGDSGIYVWGSQLEIGPFPTSYIPTQASAITRATDVAQITGKNFSSFYNQNEGSVFCKYDRIGLSGADTPWGLNDGTSATLLSLVGGVANLSQRRFDIRFEGVNLMQLLLSSSETTNTFYKVAVFYKNRDSAGSFDGGSLVRGTPSSIPVVNTLSIGRASLPSPSSILNGHISRLTYYPKRLPDANLQALTR